MKNWIQRELTAIKDCGLSLALLIISIVDMCVMGSLETLRNKIKELMKK